MRHALRLSLIATALSVALAGCGGVATSSSSPVDEAPPVADSPAPADAPEPEPEPEPEPDPEPDRRGPEDPEDTAQGPASAAQDHVSDFEVRIVGSTIELVSADGTTQHGFGLADGETFHGFAVRPGSSVGELDVAAITLRGERPVLHAVTVRGDAAVFTTFPDHLQPRHELDAAPPMLEWTPDGQSLLWTEPTLDGVVLRTVGWDDGPGTGRTADDNASFVLDAPADVQLGGFVVTDDGWDLLLRPGGGDPIELRIERQADGALALPD